MNEIGSQVGDAPRNVTLRQAIAQGRALPTASMVTRIFRPGRYGAIGLVTEAGYKVAVGDTSPLFSVLLGFLETLEDSDTCLAIRIDDRDRCSWTLVSLEGTKCEWRSFDWGVAVEEASARVSPAPKQTAAPADDAGAQERVTRARARGEHQNPPSLR